jgi:uncharacterized phiE125 gp8 family phage protein
VSDIVTSTQLITAATSAAVSVTQLKAQLPVRISGTGDDLLLEQLIATAQEEIEVFTGMKLMASTYDFNLTAFPAYGIVLPFTPIKSITSVKYYDTAGVQQTWSATNYFYNLYEQPFKIRYVDSVSIPSTNENKFEAVTVRFVAGFTSPNAVPAPIRQAILLLATDLYINRDDKVRTMFTMWQRLATPYRVFHSLDENKS